MSAVKINVTEPDFLVIKDNLKNFLRSQTEFVDYDFEGSGMAVLLDLLAYNTAYIAFYDNMVANEIFIDSAVQRDSLSSRAKMLGYSPRSKRGAVAYVDIEVFPDDSPSTITIARGTKFASVLDGITYTFSTLNGYVLIADENGDYKVGDVPLTEGEVLQHKFTWDDGDPDQRFILPNTGVDSTTLRVRVQESSSNLTTFVYQLANDLNVINATSKVYFIQEIEGSKHEIYFGDGVVGLKPKNGNIIIVDYLVSHGTIANGMLSFQAVNGVGGYSSYTLTDVQKSSNGSEEEGDESIRFLAPLWYQAQGRAITKNDYETLLKIDYSNIDSIRVWGGEDNDPPFYGKVFVSIKPLDGLTLSEQIKKNLVDNVIRKRNMVSVEVEIVDPDYVYIVVTTTVKWKSSLTSDSQAEVQETIRDAIIQYGEEELDNFDTYFRYSKFIQRIDSSHTAVLNSLTDIKLKYKLVPSFTITKNYTINFSNRIDSNDSATGEPTLSSTGFTLDGYTCFFEDDGDGAIRIYRNLGGERVVVRANIGTIDYKSGRIQINQFLPTAIFGGASSIDLTVRPFTSDVATQRNQLLLIDEEKLFIDMIDEAL